jgi:hypothetical protein
MNFLGRPEYINVGWWKRKGALACLLAGLGLFAWLVKYIIYDFGTWPW